MICALALIAAMDVSGSISYPNYVAQRDATAAALTSPGIVRVIEEDRPVAISIITWGDIPHVSVPWRIVRNESDMETLATEIRQMIRSGSGSTNMYSAIDFSLRHFDSVPCQPERMVIDVSGDGQASDEHPDPLREVAEQNGIQINGLPIITAQEPDVADYYRDRVVTRDGFVIVADGWDDYLRAIRRKLVLEIARIEE
jgi:Ca-activated chloride channel family protein